MSGSRVLFKLRSERDFDEVSFSGMNIMLGDLKAAIAQKRQLSTVMEGRDDLIISSDESGARFLGDTTLIPKNSSVIVERVPRSHTAPGGRGAAASTKFGSGGGGAKHGSGGEAGIRSVLVRPNVSSGAAPFDPTKKTTEESELRKLQLVAQDAEKIAGISTRRTSSRSHAGPNLLSGFVNEQATLPPRMQFNSRQPRGTPSGNVPSKGNTGIPKSLLPPPSPPPVNSAIPYESDKGQIPNAPATIYDVSFRKVTPPLSTAAAAATTTTTMVQKPNSKIANSGGWKNLASKSDRPASQIDGDTSRTPSPSLGIKPTPTPPPPPLSLICPLTHHILENPVTVPCCHATCSSDALKKELEKNPLCPICKKEEISFDKAVPNQEIQQAIEKFQVSTSGGKIEPPIPRETAALKSNGNTQTQKSMTWTRTDVSSFPPKSTTGSTWNSYIPTPAVTAPVPVHDNSSQNNHQPPEKRRRFGNQ